ncbi:MAG: SPOR domain-containing protein, partial [Methylococcales bacterium]
EERPSAGRILLLGESPQTNNPHLIAKIEEPRQARNPPSNREAPPMFEALKQTRLESVENDSERPIPDLLNRELDRQITDDPKPSSDNPENSDDSNRQTDLGATCCPNLKVRTAVSGADFVDKDAAVQQAIPPQNRKEAVDEPPAVNPGDTATAPTQFDGTPKLVAKTEKACYKIGPRASSSNFKSITEFLKQAGIKPVLKTETAESETGFSVYHPAAKSVEASKANVKKLQANGVNDLFLVNQGPEKGNISLGFFKSRGRAETFKKQLEAKKIKARIRTTRSERSTYHLVFEWPNAQDELKAGLHGSGFKDKELIAVGTEKCGI